MNRFFKLPAGMVIEPATNTSDLYIRAETVRAWYREDRDIDGEMVPVVVIDDGFAVEGSNSGVVRDGSWSSQLDSCVGGCDGGGPTPPPGDGSVRSAFGGIFQPNPTGYTEIQFPVMGEWVVLDNSKLELWPYEPDGTDEFAYDMTENSMTLDWADPPPIGRQFAQITVVWSVAAVGNDQIYEFGLIFNDTQITSPSSRAVLSFERAGDVETLVQQGHGTVQPDTKIQLVVRNVNGMNPLRLYTVNMRATVSVLDATV